MSKESTVGASKTALVEKAGICAEAPLSIWPSGVRMSTWMVLSVPDPMKRPTATCSVLSLRMCPAALRASPIPWREAKDS